MNTTSRTFTLPDSHLAALEQEAVYAEMHPDKALAQAIRVYQLVNSKARDGLSLAFTDRNGQLVKDITLGLPAFD